MTCSVICENSREAARAYHRWCREFLPDKAPAIYEFQDETIVSAQGLPSMTFRDQEAPAKPEAPGYWRITQGHPTCGDGGPHP